MGWIYLGESLKDSRIDINIRGDYLELARYICGRKAYGDGAFKRVGRGRCEERWVWLGTRLSRAGQ